MISLPIGVDRIISQYAADKEKTAAILGYSFHYDSADRRNGRISFCFNYKRTSAVSIIDSFNIVAEVIITEVGIFVKSFTNLFPLNKCLCRGVYMFIISDLAILQIPKAAFERIFIRYYLRQSPAFVENIIADKFKNDVYVAYDKNDALEIIQINDQAIVREKFVLTLDNNCNIIINVRSSFKYNIRDKSIKVIHVENEPEMHSYKEESSAKGYYIKKDAAENYVRIDTTKMSECIKTELAKICGEMAAQARFWGPN